MSARLLLPWLVFTLLWGAGARAQSAAPFAEQLPRTPLITEDDTILWVQVAVDRPRKGEEGQLLSYLQDFIGFKADETTLRQAEARLMRLGRYKAAVCRLWTKEEHRGRLKCGLSRARTIRRIIIEGLPAQLLETDLRKRIFMRPGERLDRRDRSGRDRIARQRGRIEEYLRRQGFFGSRVSVVTPPVSQSADVDVLVRIEGGRFVHVHEVKLVDPGPLPAKDVKRAFGWMCLAGDALIDAFETYELKCFTRDQVRATVEHWEKKLRDLGYPEGRLRVSPTVIDPTASDAPPGCGLSRGERARMRDEKAVPPAPRCVDLEVKVTAGPHLEIDLKVAKGFGAFDDRIPTPRGLGFADGSFRLVEASLGAVRRELVEPASRVTQVLVGDDAESARDSDLYFTDLERALTFDEARAADPVEAERSRRALLDALGDRGRFDARVEMRHEPTDDGYRVIYRIWPGPVSGVEVIRFFGNDTFSKDELTNAVTFSTTRRSATKNGFVSATELDNDVSRLIEFYESRGFREADVRVEAFRNPTGGTEVHFRIDEGERFTISKLKVEGGIKSLLPELLGVIAHCQTGKAKKDGRKPTKVEDCVGNAFLPDQFELDQKRILNLYASRGYPYVHVEVTPGFGPEGPELDIAIYKNATVRDPSIPPEAVELGEIFLDGNDNTERTVLLRELDLKHEASATSALFPAKDKTTTLAPVDVAQGISRLRRSGLFNRVRFEYIGLEEEGERAHLRVQVEERPSLTWDASAAFSTDRLFSLRTEARDRNLLGRMLDLDLLADVGLFIGRYTIVQAEGRWPRFFGFPIWFRVAPAAIYEDRPASIVPRSPGSLGPVAAKASWFAGDPRRRNLKGLTTFGMEYRPPGQDFYAGLDFEFRIEWDDSQAAPIAPLSLEALSTVDGLTEVVKLDPQWVSTFKPRFSYRKLDNPFDPTKGWWLDLNFRGGAPPLNSEFLGQGEVQSAAYHTIGRLTFAGHARMWAGASYGDPGRKSTLLQQDQLALGGDRSIRGYARDAVGISDLPGRVQEGEDVTQDGFLALGGVQLNGELRFTLLKNFFIGDLKLAAFTDMGFVTYNDTSLLEMDPAVWIDPDHPRMGLSFGAGLRYVLPVGPVAVDFAASPMPGTPWAVHIQLGYPF